MSAPRDMQDEARKYLERTAPTYSEPWFNERVKPVPMIRIRISTDFQASTKRIEPSVTVEIVAPADGSVDETAFWKELETVRTAAMIEFANVLRNTEEVIVDIRPAVGGKS